MKYKLARESGLPWIKAREREKERQRRKLYPSDANYYPFKRLRQAQLFYAAEACLQVVLDQSECIRALYAKVVNAWGLPDCFPR